MTIPQAFQIALQRQQAGQPAEAEALCRQILMAQPNQADALHLIGLNAYRAGRQDVAVDFIRRAVAARPAEFRYALDLGNAFLVRGDFEDAVSSYRRALEMKPDSLDALNNMGAALARQGLLDDAIPMLRRAIKLKPDYVESYVNLGNALRERGQLNEAVTACRAALGLAPDYPPALNNLGAALSELGQIDESVAVFRRALELAPGYLEAHNNLGNALRDGGHLDEAVAVFRRALQLKPDYADAHNNLGNTLKDRGEVDAAIAEFRLALRYRPEDATLHSNVIYTLHFHPGYNEERIDEEHERWNQKFEEPLKRAALPYANDQSPNRRLRIGYVSPDFYDQAESYFVAPLFEEHDHARFEIHAYANVRRPDATTERLRNSVDVWHDARGVSDAALSEQIRKDGIDVLVDLTMHMRDNRLLLFSRRPAPVQVSWLAYPGSAGLRSIGYRLTDAHMEPLGGPAAGSGEDAVRLPGSWCCYLPIGESPEVNALPALSNGHVTFGALNNFCKVHDGVLERWSRMLGAVEGSRLMMLCPEGSARERVRRAFEGYGIAEERVELIKPLPRSEYLRLYGRIDIALDPFPYNGITTTCDALWMGVPVLALPGRTAASRASMSLLLNAGLPEWIADSEAGYLRIGAALAADLRRLAEMRATLRPKLTASPLMDGERFARNVEAAYRTMWERWCAQVG